MKKTKVIIYEYGDKLKHPFDKENMSEIIMKLKERGAEIYFDSIVRHDNYNFTPVLLHDDVEAEKVRIELEELDGGRRVRKSRKTKKTKKTVNKKGKTTKRRKNMKK